MCTFRQNFNETYSTRLKVNFVLFHTSSFLGREGNYVRCPVNLFEEVVSLCPHATSSQKGATYAGLVNYALLSPR